MGFSFMNRIANEDNNLKISVYLGSTADVHESGEAITSLCFCPNLYYDVLAHCWQEFIDSYSSKQEQYVSDSQVVGCKLIH